MPLTEADEALKEVILSMNLTDEQLMLIDEKWHTPSLNLSPNSKVPHVFMTINLDRERSPRDLYEQVLTLTPRISALHGAICCLEFVPHPHVHILHKRPTNWRKANQIRSVVRALGLARPELCDILTGVKRQDYRNRQAYIRGEKASDEKLDRCAQDSQIRDEHEIPHFFSL